MMLKDRYNEIKEYCTEEEYIAYLQRVSPLKAERLAGLNEFDFLMQMPEEIRKRDHLSEILKELYDTKYLKGLTYNQNPFMQLASKTKGFKGKKLKTPVK